MIMMAETDSLSWHDPLTSHLVEGMLTLECGRVGAVLGRADSNTELVDCHVAVDVSDALDKWSRSPERGAAPGERRGLGSSGESECEGGALPKGNCGVR